MKLSGPTFFAGTFALFVACGVVLKLWRTAYLDEYRPMKRWPCDQCPAVFKDRDPDRLDRAIHEHWLAHERSPKKETTT